MDFITDEQLEDALQKSETSISDDGFTESVLARLPKRKSISVKPRCWTLAGAAAIGSFLTLLLAPPIEKAFGLYKITRGSQTTIFRISC